MPVLYNPSLMDEMALDPTEVNAVITSECDQWNRETLLRELRDLLELPKVTPVAWACLWFADMSRLHDLIAMARKAPGRAALSMALKSLGPDFVKTWLDQAVPRCRLEAVTCPDFEEGPFWGSESSATEDGAVAKEAREKRKFDQAFSGEGEGEGEGEEEEGEEGEEDGEGEEEEEEREEEGEEEEEVNDDDDNDDADYVYGSRKERKECLERDKGRCLVTRIAWPLEVAHVVPSIGTTRPASATFWDTLALFWEEDTVSSWAWELNGPDVCENAMCMASHVHDAWKKARFALKPTSYVIGRSVSFTFYWLNCKTPPSMVSILECPKLNSKRVDEGPHFLKFWENVEEKKICSGRGFQLQTSDPARRPLPSWGLLQMQWLLQRIVAFSGVADPLEEEESDEDDEDYDTQTEGSSDIAEEDYAEALKKEVIDLTEKAKESARKPQPSW